MMSQCCPSAAEQLAGSEGTAWRTARRPAGGGRRTGDLGRRSGYTVVHKGQGNHECPTQIRSHSNARGEGARGSDTETVGGKEGVRHRAKKHEP